MELDITFGQRMAMIVTFFIYTVAIVAVSLWAKRSMDKAAVDSYVEEFYTGGRGLGVLAVAFMIAAGLCGAGTLVGGPWLLINASQIFVTFVVLGEIGKKIGIIARRIDAQSYLDLLVHRFNGNKVVILFGVMSVTVFMLSFVVGQTVGGARIFEALTGLPYWIGLLLFAATVLIVTVFGGLRGVALAIIVQGIAMTIAVACLVIGAHVAVTDLGGWEHLMRGVAAREPEYFDPFRWSYRYEFSQWIIYGFAAISLPHLAMGALTYKSVKAMRKAAMLGIVIVTFWTLGLGIYCALAAKGIFTDLKIADHAVPVLTMKVVPTWLAGITLAGVASAVQSTVAAIIIVISSTLVINCYKALIAPKVTPEKLKKVSLLTTSALSVAVFIFALNPPDFLQLVITFSMGGMAAAFFFAMLLGCYWKRCNEYGTYLVVELKLLPFDISMGMHTVAVSMLVGLLLLIGVSLVTPKTPKGIIMTWFGRRYPREITD